MTGERSCGATDGKGKVAVIIAAYRAADTIASAIRSALAEPEVAEVIVVDDASPDATVAAARAADDGTGRLRVERLSANSGPGAARNRAIALSQADFIAVLDSDDIVLPGRFARICALGVFDLAADNIVFVSSLDEIPADLPEGQISTIDAADYVAANISRPGRERAELGFLKPMFRRSFLDAHGLRYNPAMRLGEDYELVLRALIAGGRFALTTGVGYVALVRDSSLSGAVSTEALWVLSAAERDMIARFDPEPLLRRQMERRARQCEAKAALRSALDAKAAGGYGGALAYALRHPGQIYDIAKGVLVDKLGPSPSAAKTPRFLMAP